MCLQYNSLYISIPYKYIIKFYKKNDSVSNKNISN